MKITHKGFIVPLLLVLVALLLVGGAYVYVQNKSSNAQTTDVAGVKTFTSEKLGIKFKYLASQGDPVIQEGNRVYVGGKEGQWVEEFKKNTGDDIGTAVKKQLLSEISDKDCEVNVEHKSPTIDTATIQILGFDTSKGDGLDNPRWNDNPCPADYRQTNGIRYFWMDKTHPNHFFFFSIGQYAILGESDRFGSGEKKSWFDTFEVVP